MSDDWVGEFMRRQNEKREEERLRMQRAEWARREAPGVFDRLRERLRKDLERFHTLGGDQSLVYTEPSPGVVQISRANYPAVTLRIELGEVTIECRWTYLQDDTCFLRDDRRSLGIAASADGNVQIYQNGSPYRDELEASEFLLKPVFSFIY